MARQRWDEPRLSGHPLADWGVEQRQFGRHQRQLRPGEPQSQPVGAQVVGEGEPVPVLVPVSGEEVVEVVPELVGRPRLEEERLQAQLLEPLQVGGWLPPLRCENPCDRFGAGVCASRYRG